LILDLSALASACADLDRLTLRGWTFGDRVDHIAGTRSGLADPVASITDLRCFGDAADVVRAVGTFGPLSVHMSLINGTYEMTSISPDGDLQQYFDEPQHRDLAIQLQDREPETAYALPLVWQVSVELRLGSLVAAGDDLEVQVQQTTSVLTKAIHAGGLEGLVRYVPAAPRRRLYVILKSEEHGRHFGAMSITGLLPSIELPARSKALPGEPTTHFPTPSPSEIVPLEPRTTQGPFEEVAEPLAAGFVASAWHRIASDVDPEGTTADFLGFKRVRLKLSLSQRFDDETVIASDALYRWAFQDPSPDRILAIRQVASLYEDSTAVTRPRDVLDSAEVVFIGLRSEAVAEALKTTRDAHAHAVDAVRQTISAVQGLAKSATERTLASLVAVGAVVAANATKVLANDVGRNLLLVVAAFLVLLALFSLLIEGPLLSLPLAKLNDDLRSSYSTLSDTQRARVLALPSIAATRRRVLVLRISALVVYLGLALLLVVFGFPDRYH
jgi:hypothetical protein